MSALKIETNNVNEAVKQINKHRLNNKNKWYQFHGTINGKEYKAKAYNTWLQVFIMDNRNAANCMDETPGQFKNHLTNVLNR